MSASIQVVFNHLPAIAGQLDGIIETALDLGAATAIATADPLTPVDTGALRGNKTIERSSGYRAVTWNQDYAAYQNMGTSRGVPAHGFAEAGMDAAVPVVQAHLGRFGR